MKASKEKEAAHNPESENGCLAPVPVKQVNEGSKKKKAYHIDPKK
ncbi:MAG TPA: hypothetical protein VNU93_08345 [Verrucomicrobiae bacterium]|nr:hypothetical protein [Verrucomicrobiae bacterium]